MKTEAKAPSKKVDVREKCKSIKLTAESESDQEFLARVYRCLTSGGRMTLEEKKEQT